MPELEGPACRVRGTTFDNPSRFTGRDKRVPPQGGLGDLRTNNTRTLVGKERRNLVCESDLPTVGPDNTRLFGSFSPTDLPAGDAVIL